MFRSPLTAVLGLAAASLLYALPCSASATWLIRIDRDQKIDRNTLISAGVVLVSETNDSWFAIGEPEVVSNAVGELSLGAEPVIDLDEAGHLLFVAPRSGFETHDTGLCGRLVASGDRWRLVANRTGFSPECLESPAWFARRLDLDPMLPEKAPPARWTGFANGTESIVPDPLVQEMVDAIDTVFALSHWQALSESPDWTTRYSPSQGCFDASTYVRDLFAAVGLGAELQSHTSGYAPNAIGTLTGSVRPDEVYIALGHLDDLPSSGPAPGADDNASGTAMVTAAAEIMAGYCFESTVKFLAVTGEEQGLHGSDHYADLAAAAGENIQAALNADMIGWEGNTPATEDLDVIYNSSSQWLAQAMIDAASGYGTGMTINDLDCPGLSASDHWPFWQNGYSAILGITDDEGLCGSGGSYPHYHQSSDTIANCGPGGPDFEAASIRTYVATLAHLAQPIARVPATPTGLAALPDGDNRIALSWSPPAPGAVVSVRRALGSCAAPGVFTEIGTTAGATFVDTGASGNVPYAYTIAAVVAGSCSSPTSTCIDATTTGVCTEPPVFAGIETITTPGQPTCSIDLGWQPPETVWCGGPASYNVYRSTDPAFTPSVSNRVAGGITGTSWTDMDVVFGEDYHYIVRAVDQANGLEEGNLTRGRSTPEGPPVIGTWTDNAGDTGAAKLSGDAPWSVEDGAGVAGAAYATGAYPSSACIALTGPPTTLGVAPHLTFWSRFDIENGWDKGELQISTDGGGSWNRVSMTYPGSSGHTNDACQLGTGTFFTGNQTSFAEYNADLSGWAGQEVRLRWLFSSDSYLEGAGWWIDDISITSAAIPGSCTTVATSIFADGFESGDTTAWHP